MEGECITPLLRTIDGADSFTVWLLTVKWSLSETASR